MGDSKKNTKYGGSLLKGFISRQKEDLGREEKFHWPEWLSIFFVLLLTFLILLLVFTPDILLNGYKWKAGDISQRPLIAPFSFSVENKEETERLRRAAEQNSPLVFSWDDQSDDRILGQSLTVLSTAHQIALMPNLKRQEKVDLILENVGFPLSRSGAETLLRFHGYRQLKETVVMVMAAMDTTPVVSDEAMELAANGENLQVYDDENNQLLTFKQFAEDHGNVISQSQFQGIIKKIVTKNLPHPEDVPVQKLILDIYGQLLQPNLILDNNKTSEVRSRYRHQVKPVMEYINKGYLIAPAMKPINEYQIRVLDELFQNRLKYGFSILLGRSVLILLFGYFTALYLRRYYPKFTSEFNSMAPLCMLVVITISMTRLVLWLGGSAYLIPIAAFAMLAGILFEMRFALLMSTELSVFMGVMMGLDVKYVLIFLASGTVASFAVAHILRRTDLLKAGLLVSMINAIGILAIFFFDHPLYSTFHGKWTGLWIDLLSGICNGLLCYGATLFFIPLFEWLFNLTTDVKLLEFTDPRAPALARLEEIAPGTYQHSLNVGQLAEAAALDIGANALLCRIGGYYQDIGKILKPEYFVENQQEEDERKIHDKLTPNMSCLIIKNHVKYGVELAKEYKLPPPVIDIITQHHGTSLITFFYHKAQEIRENDSDETELNEDDFRYPGPKPQTTESAIVMLADSVEAAVASIRHHTAGAIQSMVHKVINDKFTDEQLNECDITMKDLELIKESLVRTLISKYHRRIAYPGQPNGITRGDSKKWAQNKNSISAT
jgi:putative nucleotidyltransferase with HDIG domain